MKEILTFHILGLGLMFLGYMISKKQVIGIIHSYHYTKVQPKDKKKYCQYMGLGSVIAGIACIQYPYLNYIFLPLRIGEIVFFVILGVALICIIYSQLKYNKGIF